MIRPAALLLPASILMLAADRMPAERVVMGDAPVAARLNGVPVMVRIDPGAPGIPLFDHAAAMRAGVKSGMLGFSFGFSVGGQGAMHASGTATIDLGTGQFTRRVGWPQRPRNLAADAAWHDHPYSRIGDGTIGPGAVPEPVVRFVLRPAQPGERTIALPMIDGGGVFGRFAGLFARIMVGGEPMRVRFDPWHAHTIANAGAGRRLADIHGGRLTGEAVPVEIAFGIARPVRTMRLATPLTIGPVTLATIGVRTSDASVTDAIPETEAPAADPDEIVVTAKGKHDPDRDRLSLGADTLARCSSIVFDKDAKVIRLTCA